MALVAERAARRGRGGDRVSGRPLERAILGAASVGLGAAPLLVAPFTVTLLDYVGIGALVALGLVLLTGFGGLTSVGQASLVGIGAYATAWLCTRVGADPWRGPALAPFVAGARCPLPGAGRV